MLVLVSSQNVVNKFETCGRVTDMIASFTSHIESTVLQSLIEFEMNRGVVNKTTQTSDNMVSVVKVNPHIIRLSFCLENGLFQGHINEHYHLKNQTLSDICVKQKPFQIPGWSSPYVTTSYSESYSVLSYKKPLYDSVNGSNIYLGMIAADISYGSLSTFLSATYNNTDKNVFIVDKKTGALMGSSTPAQLLHIPAQSYHHSNEIVSAIQSENALIYGATQYLMDHEWPEDLLIYGKYYLESVLYENQGISWHVVVASPAVTYGSTLESDSPYYPVSIFVISLALAVNVIALACMRRYHTTKLFRLSQPLLCILVLLGNIFLCITCFVLLGDNNKTLCAVRPYLFNLSFTLAIAPLLVKACRVYSLFILNPLQKNKTLKVYVLIMRSFFIVFVDLFIIVTTMYSSTGTAPVSSDEISVNGNYSTITYCAYQRNDALFYTEIAYKALLMCLICVVSIQIRNIPGALAGTHAVINIAYNTTFVSVMVILISQLTLDDVPLSLLIEILGICFCVIVNACFLVVPLMYSFLMYGDEVAANDVLEELFTKNKDAGPEKGNQIKTSKIAVCDVESAGT